MNEYEEERLTDVETDIAYALGEIQNIQTELGTYFDPEDGLVLVRFQQLAEQLEGIEARLGEIQSTLRELDVATTPAYVFTDG